MTDHKYPSQTAERFQIRLPDGMRDAIRDAAEKNGRSMNAEIVHRLEASLAIGKLSPHEFLSVQEWEAENSKKLADALRRIANSVELLGSGALEMLADRPEDG